MQQQYTVASAVASGYASRLEELINYIQHTKTGCLKCLKLVGLNRSEIKPEETVFNDTALFPQNVGRNLFATMLAVRRCFIKCRFKP